MSKPDLSGMTALVTGASSGLGVDFARELARRGCTVVLVARREDLLSKVAAELESSFGTKAHALPCDLSAEDAGTRLHQDLASRGLAIDILVNNAGYGVYGQFVDIDWQRERAMLELDIVTLTHLTKLFGRDMVGRGRGYILQVASIGAYQPSPTYATYAAAKAYVLNFGEALNYELRGTGVSCTVVSPGVTATEFLSVSGQSPTRYQRLMMMKSPDVVRIAVRAMLKRKGSVVPGFWNALTMFSTRLMPRRALAALANWLMTSG